jgi:hypothetical protein
MCRTKDVLLLVNEVRSTLNQKHHADPPPELPATAIQQAVQVMKGYKECTRDKIEACLHIYMYTYLRLRRRRQTRVR